MVPRARNLNFRTMEVFRGLGLSNEIHTAGAHVSRIFARERLGSGQYSSVRVGWPAVITQMPFGRVDRGRATAHRFAEPEHFLFTSHGRDKKLDPTRPLTSWRTACAKRRAELASTGRQDDGAVESVDHDHAQRAMSTTRSVVVLFGRRVSPMHVRSNRKSTRV